MFVLPFWFLLQISCKMLSLLFSASLELNPPLGKSACLSLLTLVKFSCLFLLQIGLEHFGSHLGSPLCLRCFVVHCPLGYPHGALGILPLFGANLTVSGSVLQYQMNPTLERLSSARPSSISSIISVMLSPTYFPPLGWLRTTKPTCTLPVFLLCFIFVSSISSSLFSLLLRVNYLLG